MTGAAKRASWTGNKRAPGCPIGRRATDASSPTDIGPSHRRHGRQRIAELPPARRKPQHVTADQGEDRGTSSTPWPPRWRCRCGSKALVGTSIAFVGPVAFAGAAFADHCTNIQRDQHDPSKGVQVVINLIDGSIESANAGVQNRIQRGKIDPATGEGFRGRVGLDLDGDQTVDVMTYQVGPTGTALPETAIHNGSPDHGIVDIGTVLGG